MGTFTGVKPTSHVGYNLFFSKSSSSNAVQSDLIEGRDISSIHAVVGRAGVRKLILNYLIILYLI